MNASSPSYDPSVHEQAALWSARLDGSKLSTDDQTELDAWLAANPAHRAALAQYRDFSAELDEVLPALVQAGLVPAPESAQPAHRRSWGLFAVAGSAFAGAAAVAVALWIGAPARQSQQLATQVAQRQSVTLADGTRIDLNAHTQLQVEIGRVERHVRLSGGEAFFQVSKDKSRPFTVDTAAGSVRVTGTAFDVRTTDTHGLEVTVVEGSVHVQPNRAGTAAQLGAGQKLSTTAEGVSVQTLSPAEIANALAWREGRVVFQGVPLQDALAEMGRYHGCPIVATPDAADIRLGGRYSLDDLNGFFAALEESLPVKVTPLPDGAIQVSRRADR